MEKELNSQISFFDGAEPFKVGDREIKLIELFAGIGAQAKALTRLSAEGLCRFSHHRICEFDRFAVASYNAIHGTNFEPSDITQLKGSDLGITDTDKYVYMLTYSFPCTDLSLAGKQEGMSKGSGTRSGLLWEVERLLNEVENLPQVLIMENVPQVICDDFFEWCRFLESKGYHNEYKLMNSRDYGIPQNRNRCFMVSLLGDYSYSFPEPFPLTKRLKDVLEDEVDEKYYLSEKATNQALKRILQTEDIDLSDDGENRLRQIPALFLQAGKEFAGTTDVAVTLKARDYKGMANREASNGVIEILDEQNGYIRRDGTVGTLTTDGSSPKHNNRVIEYSPRRLFNIYGDNRGTGFAGNVWDTQAVSPSLITMQGGNREPLITTDTEAKPLNPEPDGTSRTIKAQYANSSRANFQRSSTFGATGVKKGFRIRKLTPKECLRLMDFDDSDYERAAKVNSASQLYKQAGNSIVVNCLYLIIKSLL